MPVHEFLDDKLLLDKGLRNYWGYNSINFFALRPRVIVRPVKLGSKSASSKPW